MFRLESTSHDYGDQHKVFNNLPNKTPICIKVFVRLYIGSQNSSIKLCKIRQNHQTEGEEWERPKVPSL